MNNYQSYLWGLGLIVLSLVVMALGLVPRSMALILFLAEAALVTWRPLKQAALWFWLFLPWSVALPVSPGLDTLSGWRLLVIILFIRWLVAQGGRGLSKFWHQSPLRLRWLLGLAAAWLVWAGWGLLVTQAPLGQGVKQLLFFANAFFLIPLFVTYQEYGQAWREAFVKLGLWSWGLSLAIGFFQQVSILFVSLTDFWQWWASRVTPIFSGAATGELLSYSNTWFSYWPGDIATLRSFGTFPDSHAYALAGLLWLILVVAWDERRRWLKNLMILAGFLLIMLSGTRGALASGLILAGVWAFGQLFKRPPTLLRLKSLAGKSFILLILAAPLGSAIWGATLLAEFNRAGLAGQFNFLALIRARSIFDLDEVSNKGRLEIWRSSLKSIKEKPVWGAGLGNFPSVVNENLSRSRAGSSAHSLYLQFATETGLVGLGFMLVIGGLILGSALTLAGSPTRETALLGIGTAVYFMWLFGYSVVDVVLLNDRVLALFMILVGVIFGLNDYDSKAAARGR